MFVYETNIDARLIFITRITGICNWNGFGCQIVGWSAQATRKFQRGTELITYSIQDNKLNITVSETIFQRAKWNSNQNSAM